MGTRWGAWTGAVLLLAAPFARPGFGEPAPGAPGASGAGTAAPVVFNGEGNRLNAYDSVTGARQTVIPNAEEGGLDINAQICFRRIGDRTFFIAGEDTFQGDEARGGSPGWGWFELSGERVGELSAFEWGKLVPTWSGADQAENYGCGFLPDGRLLTTDVGDQLPHQPASGQLIVWFPDATGGFADATSADRDIHTIDNSLDADYCKVDVSIGTAGGIWVEGGWVYVAATRPGPNGPGGVYRYEIADLPTDSSCAGHGRDEALVDAGAATRELWLPSDDFALTPSAVVPTGRSFEGNPTWYVSSVFNGVVAEYADLGPVRVHLRNVVEPPGGGSLLAQADEAPANDAGTPFGIGVTPDGTLWYADLGIQGPGPADGRGSVQRVAFGGDGAVASRAIIDEGLDFPDGIGVFVPPAGATAAGAGAGGGPASAWPCPDWGMYGRTPARTFSTDCPSRISPQSVQRLVPAWVVKTEKTVTASPAVVGGRLFVGDWSGTMYALDTASGEVLWTAGTDPAPGAAFGPIVSSAAVADVPVRGATRRLVVFGAGPRVYALDASDGSRVWTADLGAGVEGTPTEVESSPVVWGGTVYVGMDTHGEAADETGGVRGGVVALDAANGAQLWKFEPETDRPGSGCGGVWSSPALDTARGLLFAATANCPEDDFDWTPYTEAVFALDAATGSPVWSFRPHEKNGNDWDFGATPNLFHDLSGRAVLGAGNKDGAYYALDPATGGVLWKSKVAEPGDVDEDFSIGGFIGSPAVWHGNVFGTTALGGPPYYHSLSGRTGGVRWRGLAVPSYAASGVVNGVVFAGALDGVLRAFHADSGAVLWSAPLAGPASSGPAVVGDRVYVGSGTSSSDACAKGAPGSDLCETFFGEALGSLGGIHAFTLPDASGSPPPPDPTTPTTAAVEGSRVEATGGGGTPIGPLAATGIEALALASLGLASLALSRLRRFSGWAPRAGP